jgi:hypothetical protein
MFKGFFWVLAWTLVATSAARAQDPQAQMNALIQRQMQQDEVRQQNSMMRLELERLDLEQQLRLRRANDSQVEEELSRYCPNGAPPCLRTPPDVLLQEAARRGLIEYRAGAEPQRQPGLECLTMGDGEGGGITDCH